MQTIRDVTTQNRRALVRCDLNVPLDEHGNILDDFRIRAVLPTIEYLAGQNAKVILISHLDDPKGRDESLSLSPVAIRLAELLGLEVRLAPDCIGDEIQKIVGEMQGGDVSLLENLRFHDGEKKNDPEFARSLAVLGDIFVQDAFGACHRAHASIVGVPKLLPSYAGLLLEKEITALDRLLENVKQPFVVVVGGKKVETKVGMIERFVRDADHVLVGHLVAQAMRAQKIAGGAKNIAAPQDGVERNGKILDIGPRTRELFAEKLRGAKTILWNGPLGFIEDEQFAQGTMAVANAIMESGAFSVVGGGETVEFINRHGLADKFSHVSTGGGAMLAYLSGETLPGLDALHGK